MTVSSRRYCQAGAGGRSLSGQERALAQILGSDSFGPFDHGIQHAARRGADRELSLRLCFRTGVCDAIDVPSALACSLSWSRDASYWSSTLVHCHGPLDVRAGSSKLPGRGDVGRALPLDDRHRAGRDG